MVEIESEYLKVKISLDGGSMTSIYDKKYKQELLYQVDERSWHGQDVVIFPFVARLKNSSYMVDGTTYSMKNHGLIRYNKLYLVEKKDNSVTLAFDSNEDTLKQYPYRFHFEIKYIVEGYKLSIKYNVTNTDTKDIYYEFGGHPALKVSGSEVDGGFKFEDVKLEFESTFETNKYDLDETGSYITTKTTYKIPREFYVDKKLISNVKTLILDADKINNVLLVEKDYAFKFEISDAQILAVWTDPNYGNYLCVEPWWGIPDIINPNPELKDKPLIHSLHPNESEEKGYSLVVSKRV